MRHSIKKIGLFLAMMTLLFNNHPLAFAGNAVLTWDTNTDPNLAGYKVYYGTASGAYTTSIDAGNQTTYTVTGLISGTYYFATTAYDNLGNESGFSNEVSKNFSDTTPPVISAIASTNLTSSGAAIAWTTNEPSDTQVQYGVTTAYGSATVLNTSMVTAHAQNLTGLSPSTTYHFRVLSRDAAGNLAASGDNTFATLAAPDTTPPSISGVAAGGITINAATITWTTNEASDTQVQYGVTTAYGSATSINTALATSHSQGLTGLSSATTYHFRVLSKDAAGNLATSGDNVFTTSTPPDTTPPVISGIISSNIGPNSAVITWTTNEASTSQVQYGTTTAYGSSSVLNTTLLTNHSVSLTGLNSSVLYHYRVLSADAAGNTATSGDNTFTTSAAPDTTPPVLSGIVSSNVTLNSAVITWNTNEASTSQVQYGATSAYGSSSALDATLLTGHSVSLTGLSANSVYHYRVLSKDAAGNTATSGDNTFTTLAAPDTVPPVISGIAASNITSSSAVITWNTDEASTSQVEYGTTSIYGSFSQADATLVNSHSVTLTGLAPNTIYQYRVNSKDAVGNSSFSANNTFTTVDLVSPDTTPPGDVKNFTGVGKHHQVTLSWTNPSDADFVGVRVLYSTDHYPVDTNDGTLLGDFTGQPNADMSANHTGLQDGVTYYYSASTYDSHGNYQHTAHASATPIDSSSNSGASSSSGGGCGMISPENGASSGPGQAADMTFLFGFALITLCRKIIRRAIPPGRRACAKGILDLYFRLISEKNFDK